MVIARIYSGLGNQMFQYALGRHLALLNETELKLDTSALASDPLRKYDLHRLKVDENFATSPEVEIFRPREGEVAAGTWNRLFDATAAEVEVFRTRDGEEFLRVKQKDRHFDPSILARRGNLYLQGYWQTEKYFADIRPLLLKEFELKVDPDEENQNLLSQIDRCEAVAVHVRRTDYVTNPATNSHHGVLPVEYYHRAVAIMNERVKAPVFYVFSDDPQWSRKSLHLDGETVYVDVNDPSRGYEDLRLMRRCKHFIIANSSFSWWGAWLAENEHKAVIAPHQWFAKTFIDTSDIVPAGWTRI